MIHGFQKLTLLDYPGKVACTVFLGGCNFRCPFCQNARLVLDPAHEPIIEETEVLTVLKKRQGILDGVCVTGGEPTLYPKLQDFLKKIKELGYCIKLDTNGYRPDILRDLNEKGLIDYVAMDIKNSPSRYAETAGVTQLQIEKIKESVTYLINGNLDYEFRTTICRELHGEEEIKEIGQWIKGCSRYYLQGYRESEHVINPVFTSYTRSELDCFVQMLRRWIPTAEVRGVE